MGYKTQIEWFDYPEQKPKHSGNYLIRLPNENGELYTQPASYFVSSDGFTYGFCVAKDVKYWAEMPE